MNKTWIIAQREFMTRVRKKTFLLSTILMPLLIFGFYAVLIYFQVSSDNYKIAVLDPSGVFQNKIETKDADITFNFVQLDTATLRGKVEKGEYNGYLLVPADFKTRNNDSIELRSAKTLGVMTQEKINRRVNSALKERRFLDMNISKSTLDSIQQDTRIRYMSTRGNTDGELKAGVSYGVGFISGFMIYIVLFVYGTMVMRGVMEEKVSRIAEVIVSSAKPFQLMMGKIFGIGAVGLLQFVIWGILIISLQFILPLIFPDLASQMAAGNTAPMAGGVASQAPGAMAGLGKVLGQINFPLIISTFIFYFFGGYLLYSSLFAAVGSAVNEDPQDAQSLLLPIMMPIIFAIVIMTKAVNDPNSGLSIFGSLFPLTSPVVMMARIAHGIPEGVPLWQLILSMVLLIAGFLGTTWLAAKIYRTGILMYGKKITWKEMWKWALR